MDWIDWRCEREDLQDSPALRVCSERLGLLREFNPPPSKSIHLSWALVFLLFKTWDIIKFKKRSWNDRNWLMAEIVGRRISGAEDFNDNCSRSTFLVSIFPPLATQSHFLPPNYPPLFITSATSLIMVAKRKDSNNPTTPAAPAPKTTPVSAAIATLATPKTVAESKIPPPTPQIH